MQEDYLSRNKEIYNSTYSRIKVDTLIDKVRNFESFLGAETKRQTSWHGFYSGDFASRIKGKKVLELGSGDGLNALIMAALGANVTSNDISYESEKIVREVAVALQLKNIQATSGELTDLILEKQSFDFVVGKAFLHHLTHEIEMAYLSKIVTLLKPNGEARFFEPAVNSRALDTLRWIIPVRGRPSMLHKSAFAEYKKRDPHPERDNSSEHFIQVGRQYFDGAEISYFGSIERLYRLFPRGSNFDAFRRWAHRIEVRLPKWFRHLAARSQLIVYTHPRR